MICSLEEILAVFPTTISSSFGVLPIDWQPLEGFNLSPQHVPSLKHVIRKQSNFTATPRRGRNFSSEIH